MKFRITNSAALELLLLADRATRGTWCAPLHGLFRSLYRGPFTRFLQWRLRLISQLPALQLIPRHSTVQPGPFSVFRSDIDYSIVIPDDCPPHKMAGARDFYEGWRRYLPCLGELEVYTNSELRIQNELLASHGRLMAWIKLLRKFARDVPPEGGSRYHREKVELARAELVFQLTGKRLRIPRQMVDALAAALTQFVCANFSALAQAPALEFYSEFLGWHFGAGENERGLSLSGSAQNVFVALLPDTYNVSGAISTLRANRKIAEAYVAVAAFELILCRGVARQGKAISSESQNWMRHLEEQVFQHRQDVRSFDELRRERPRQSWTLADQSL